jgi:pyruvate-formate lyase-activating enzyme
MRLKILLVNPAIYDFSAYDFWLKPYGLLRVAGFLRGQADLYLFDYLDRWHPNAPGDVQHRSDAWGRGPFPTEMTQKPALFTDIPRHYRRYGLPRSVFQKFLAEVGPFDVALIQTVMTYWYPGVKEAIDDIRTLSPLSKIVLGGIYATLCPRHAQSLGADLVIQRAHLEPLWQLLRITPRVQELPLWEAYGRLPVGILKLSDGCPFRCTYCSVPQVYPPFASRPLEHAFAELEMLYSRGVRNVAFYDDALLFKPTDILLPFLDRVRQRGIDVHFHTPNALNARYVTREIAEQMVQAGFKTFYLGFESSAYTWQRRTGGKVYAEDLVQAVDNLVNAGADIRHITAYLIIGHPLTDHQDVEASMQFAHSLGVRLMLSEFSPIPGTPDGEHCRRWVNLDEPLWHNKTVFPLGVLGLKEVRRLKTLCRHLNHKLPFSLTDRV